MQFADLVKGTEFKKPPARSTSDCNALSDEVLMRDGLNSAGFILSPGKARERIPICRKCKQHTHKDDLHGLKCSLRHCYVNKAGLFLVIRCLEGNW